MAGEVQLGAFTFQDGDGQKVTEEIGSGVDDVAMPGSGSSSTLLFDFDGVINTLTLVGNLADCATTRASDNANVKTIEQQKAYLKAMVSGMQSSVAFISTFNASPGIDVMIKNMTFDEEAGNPNELPFTIKLIEGSG